MCQSFLNAKHDQADGEGCMLGRIVGQWLRATEQYLLTEPLIR